MSSSASSVWRISLEAALRHIEMAGNRLPRTLVRVALQPLKAGHDRLRQRHCRTARLPRRCPGTNQTIGIPTRRQTSRRGPARGTATPTSQDKAVEIDRAPFRRDSAVRSKSSVRKPTGCAAGRRHRRMPHGLQQRRADIRHLRQGMGAVAHRGCGRPRRRSARRRRSRGLHRSAGTRDRRSRAPDWPKNCDRSASVMSTPTTQAISPGQLALRATLIPGWREAQKDIGFGPAVIEIARRRRIPGPQARIEAVDHAGFRRDDPRNRRHARSP